MGLEISLLGQIQIFLNEPPLSKEPVAFKTSHALALLAYLAVENDHPHSRAALAGLLWPEQPEKSARHNLRQTLLYLRRCIGDSDELSYLRITRQEIQFNSNSSQKLDVADFLGHIQAVERHPHERAASCLSCLEHLEDAVRLYRGDFLEHFFLDSSPAFEEWALFKQETLRRAALQALLWLADYKLQRGEHLDASRYAWRQIELDPLREQAYRQFMSAMAGLGRRNEALSQYEALARLLEQELGVSPSADTTHLYERIKSEGDATRSPLVPSLRLPRQFTHFLGRQNSLNAINANLDDPTCGLLTLTGLGGVGKTRLSIEVAQRRAGLYRDGVVFVPLAGVESSDELAPAIALQAGIPLSGMENARRQLIDGMSGKEMLLVLDNFEHLLEDVDLLLDLLRSAPGLKILVTSRQPLNLRAEWVVQLSGLACPPESGRRAVEYPAVQLFIQAARRLSGSFDPAPSDLLEVSRITRLLDGLPLALELAAGLTLSVSCRSIADSITGGLDLLTTQMSDVPTRQRSMRAVLDYSWSQLTAHEAAILSRLAVFQGGFTAQAASTIAQASLETLSSLIQKSLLNRLDDDRYYLHELVREFAAGHLAEIPSQEKIIRAKHARFYGVFLQNQDNLLGSARQAEALDAIQVEIANLLRAWQWVARTADLDGAAVFVKGLWGYYDDRNLFEAGQAALMNGWETLHKGLGLHPLLAEIEMVIGFFAMRRGRYPEARDHLESSLSQFRRLDDLLSCANCMYYLGSVASDSGDMPAALEYLEGALQIYKNYERQRQIGNALTKLGSVLELSGRYPEARSALERSLEIKREAGAPIPISVSLTNLGLLLWRTGEYSQAEACFLEALSLSRQVDAPGSIAIALSNLARLYITQGRCPEAEGLLKESLELENQVGNLRHQTILKGLMGTLFRCQGDREKAVSWLQSAVDLGRETGNLREWAYAGYHLAQVYLDRDDFVLAREWLVQTEETASQLGLLPLRLAVLQEASRMLSAQGLLFDAFLLALFVSNHPAAWHSIRVTARERADHLRKRLSTAEEAKARQRSADLDLENAVRLGLNQS